MERISSTLSLAAILLKSGLLERKRVTKLYFLTAFIQMPLMRKTLSWTTFLLVMPFFPCLALLSFLLFPPTLALALSLPML